MEKICHKQVYSVTYKGFDFRDKCSDFILKFKITTEFILKFWNSRLLPTLFWNSKSLEELRGQKVIPVTPQKVCNDSVFVIKSLRFWGVVRWTRMSDILCTLEHSERQAREEISGCDQASCRSQAKPRGSWIKGSSGILRINGIK